MTKKDKKETTKKHYFIWLLLIIGILFIYARYLGTSDLVIKEYSIINEKIPLNFHGLKIVQFSDLHYGTTIKEEELKNVINKINELNPDIIFFTGDLIDNSYKISEDEEKLITEQLNNLEPNIGIYAVRGDHDINDNFENIIKNTNIELLNNQNKLLYFNNSSTPIMLIALDDNLKGTQNIDNAFNFEDNDYYKILITHEPDDYDKLPKNVNLFLASHSHLGQVRLPFIGSVYNMEGAKKYKEEKYEIDGTNLFISGGIGTTKIKYRFLNKPSINFFRLYNH
jgi:uncharacterized protein